MFSYFSRDRFTRDVFPNSGTEVPTGLANVATGTLLTLKFVNYVGGETSRHPVLIGEQILRFEGFKNNQKTMFRGNDLVNSF